MQVATAVSSLTADDLAREAPDRHWMLTDAHGDPIGRCSLWWQNTPAYRGHRVGMIGHYAACDAAAARRVLRYACEQLAERGCSIAVGPMDGNTWRQYRFVTERGDEPPFFLEPDNPDDWPGYFTKCGFEPVAQYFSALNTDLHNRPHAISEIHRRMAARGVQIGPLQRERFDDELRGIYAIATAAFRDNFLYRPLAESEFVAQYRTLSRHVPTDFILIAKLHDQPVGFVFAVPDLLQVQRGETIDTIVVKTLGVLPGRQFAGLGHLLLASVEQRAVEFGFVRSIHALVRDVPHLRRMSSRVARPIRRYALFAKVIRR